MTDIQVMAAQLGMSPSKARARLLRIILFDFVKQLKLDFCFQCKQKIEKLEDLTMSHS